MVACSRQILHGETAVQQVRGDRVAGQKHLKRWTGEAARSLSPVAELMICTNEGGKKVPKDAWLPILSAMRLWILPSPSLWIFVCS
jgi:hypothetical protein